MSVNKFKIVTQNGNDSKNELLLPGSNNTSNNITNTNFSSIDYINDRHLSAIKENEIDNNNNNNNEIETKIEHLLNAEQFTGRAAAQCDEFSAQVVKPILNKYAISLEGKSQLNL